MYRIDLTGTHEEMSSGMQGGPKGANGECDVRGLQRCIEKVAANTQATN